MGSAAMIGHGAILWARERDLRLFWMWLLLSVVLSVGVIILVILRRWQKRVSRSALSAGDQLSHFRELYEQGVLSKEEFEQIRAQLAEKMRQEMQVQAPPAPPETSTAPPASPPELPPSGSSPSTDGIRPE